MIAQPPYYTRRLRWRSSTGSACKPISAAFSRGCGITRPGASRLRASALELEARVRLSGGMSSSLSQIIIVAALLFCFFGGSAVAAEYVSPDRTMSVVATDRGGGDCEATIQIRDGDREFVKLDYTSPDHQHGSRIAAAAWTPDSHFFVFSTESSGGHQPWHAPIMFFSRKSGRVLPLESYVPDPITDPDFSLTPPDVLEFTSTKIPLDKNTPERRSVRLSAFTPPTP